MCDRARSWIQKSNIWFRSHPFWPFWHFYCREAPTRICKDQFHLGPYLWNICAASSVLDIVHIVPVPSPAMSTVPVPAKSKKEKTRDLKATLHSTANLNLKMTEHIGICWTCTCLLLVYHGLEFLHTTQQWVLKNQRRCCSPEGAIAWCKRSRTVNDDRVQTVKCSVDALCFCFNLLWFYLCILFANIVMLGLWWLPETNKAS